MLIRRGTLLDGRIVDIRVGERIAEVAPALARLPDEDVLDAGHGAVLPGLHDHHLHLRAAAAALDSIQVGPPVVRTSAQLAAVLARAEPGADGWIRAVGYHDSVAGELDRDGLDGLVPHRPVRVQHRSGALWILNSAGLARIGLGDHPNGRLPSADRGWGGALPRREPDLARLSRLLTGYGVTGVTDATPDLSADDVACLADSVQQRLVCLAPGKLILHDDQLDLDALTNWIAERHAAGGPVAVHCVTAAQLIVTIAALRSAGGHPLDRIEHAAMVPDDALADLARVGATVVTQPNFVAERGDQYLADIPGDELPQLWRLASLAAAGIPVAAGTDAPFGAIDPWAAIAAAVNRTTESGRVLGPAERVPAERALRMFLGHGDRPSRPRTVEAGQPGDLCVLRVPVVEALKTLSSNMVAATVIGGRLAEVG
jgi:predicted amidohydrolase YtcJ